MRTSLTQDRALLESAGIVLPKEFRGYTEDAAQPGVLTQMNAGIPAFLANFIDPKFIEILVTPMKAAEIAGERGMGNWTMKTAQFPVSESAGEVSTYGDYNNNGSASSNVNWIPRQQYIYQSIITWGDHELDMMALAKIDQANSVRNSRALTFAKAQNKSYFYGVSNLQNYGLLNDPNLSPAIAPVTKTAGGTTWAVATANEVYQDIENLFAQLQLQVNGLIDLESELVLAMSPTSEVALTKTTQFNVNVKDMVKKNFPNMRVITAVEYATASGQLVQLIAPTLQGQETVFCAFGDKLRAFPVFRNLSSFQQKFAAGTWGTVLKIPVAIGQMLGV
jgi:hypothetical protein